MDLKERFSSIIATDIIRGYSVLKCAKGTAYLKHIKMLEYLELDEFEDESFEDAIKNGIKSEKQLIDTAVERGFWSKSINEEYEALKWTVQKQNEAIEKMADIGQREVFKKSTQAVEESFKELQEKRNKIIGYSAEDLALRKRTAKLIDGNIFKDKNLTKGVSKESSVPLQLMENIFGFSGLLVCIVTFAKNTNLVIVFCLKFKLYTNKIIRIFYRFTMVILNI